MASCFWVGGTATWDGTNTGGGGTGGIKWASATGGSTTAAGSGTGGSPGSGDTATFDGASGGGTVTVGTNFSISGLTTGAFTGTISFGATTPTIGGNGWNNSGAGTRTIDLGSSVITINSTNANSFIQGVVTGLTFTKGTSNIILGGSTASGRGFDGGGKAFATVTLNANSAGGLTNITGANTYDVLAITGQNHVIFPAATIQTITTLTITGATGAEVGLVSNSTSGTAATLAVTNAPSFSWAALRDITFTTSAPTITNSFDLGHNTLNGGSIAAPSTGGGGGAGVIGS